MLALQHTLVCALQQLTLRARTPDAATAHAQSALALGAVAAWRLPGHDECRTHVLLDSDEQSPEFCARVTPIVVDASNAEPLYAPDDWDTSVPPAFRPMLISRALWIAALPCDETLVPTPPPMAVQLRLLDSLDSNVFLTTARASLHASTLMMLSLLVEHRAELRDGAFLDYGCGSGILGLAALLLGHDGLEAHATDLVDDALACARRNGILNGIDERRLHLMLPWELPRALRAHVAVANMLPGPLQSVSLEIATRVREGGLLLLTGFRASDLPAVRSAFADYFDVPDEPTETRDGWVAVACRRTAAAVSAARLSESAVE